MFLRCIEPQRELKPVTRQISTTVNQTSDEGEPVDYSPAFKLETNRKNKRIVSYKTFFSIYER